MAELTVEEKRWIASLRRVFEARPPTLGLHCGDSLAVVALNEDGGVTHRGVGRFDAQAVVLVDDGFLRVPCDGGLLPSVTLDEIERPWVLPDPPKIRAEKSKQWNFGVDRNNVHWMVNGAHPRGEVPYSHVHINTGKMDNRYAHSIDTCLPCGDEVSGPGHAGKARAMLRRHCEGKCACFEAQ